MFLSLSHFPFSLLSTFTIFHNLPLFCFNTLSQSPYLQIFFPSRVSTTHPLETFYPPGLPSVPRKFPTRDFHPTIHPTLRLFSLTFSWIPSLPYSFTPSICSTLPFLSVPNLCPYSKRPSLSVCRVSPRSTCLAHSAFTPSTLFDPCFSYRVVISATRRAAAFPFYFPL